MRATPKNIPMDDMLAAKMDKMAIRVTQKKPALDALLIIDGEEGYGKTTLSAFIAYYVSTKTNREFSDKQFYFDVDDLIDYAKNNSNKIIVWDEAALGGLSTEWSNKSQIKLMKLLMTARKKRHFIIFNIPRLKKLAPYLIERAVGLLHVYAPDESDVGYFTYYSKKNKIQMYDDFRKTKVLKYKKFYNFRGRFPDVLDPEKEYNLLDMFSIEEYDRRKDEAISKIGDEEEKMGRYRKAYLKLLYGFYKLVITYCNGIDYTSINKLTGVNHERMIEAKEIPEKYPEILEKTQSWRDS